MGHISLLSKLTPPDRRLSAAAGRCRNCCASTPPTGRPPTSRPPWSTSCAATVPSAWRSSPPPPSRPLPSGRPSSSGDSRRCRHDATIADAGGENRRRRRPRPAHAALAALPTAPRRRGPGWRGSRLTRQYVPRQPRRAVAGAPPSLSPCGPRRGSLRAPQTPPTPCGPCAQGGRDPARSPVARRPERVAPAGPPVVGVGASPPPTVATVACPPPPPALSSALCAPPPSARVRANPPASPPRRPRARGPEALRSGPGPPGGRRPAMIERGAMEGRKGARRERESRGAPPFDGKWARRGEGGGAASEGKGGETSRRHGTTKIDTER